MENISNGFGPHLMLDCKGANVHLCADASYIANTLKELVLLLGMNIIMEPQMIDYSGIKPEDRGVTGFVLIAESHISIHTFTEKDYFFLDCFSCKYFDHEIVINYIREKFEVNEIRVFLINRGEDFPRYT
jgi:S-adenosylmethionine decarboxylase